MLFKRVFAVFFLLLMCHTAWAAPLRIGTEGTYRPWTMVDAKGHVYGFDADMAHALCQKLHTECVFVVQNFDSLLPSLNAGRFDMIMTSLSITPERAKKILFSIPYASLPNAFVVQKDSDLLMAQNLPELIRMLSGKKVGVLAATTQANYLQAVVPQANMIVYDTLDQMQLDLASQRLDVGFSDISAWQDFLSRPLGKNFKQLSVVINNSEAPELLGGGVAVGLPMGRADLKQKIDQAICDLEQEGVVKKISEKWLKVDVSTHACPRH